VAAARACYPRAMIDHTGIGVADVARSPPVLRFDRLDR
jgi:hypothetical protein